MQANPPSSWKVVGGVGFGLVFAIALYTVVNGTEQRGWADAASGTAAAAVVDRRERSDACGVTGRRSRCYHLSLAVAAPVGGPRELDVNIEDAEASRYDVGDSVRVVVLADGSVALERMP